MAAKTFPSDAVPASVPATSTGVKGRVVSGGKTLAVVSDARGNVRTLPICFKFRDGVLVAIDDKSVTFHQWDPTGTNTRIYRTIVKIYKREEAKR